MLVGSQPSWPFLTLVSDACQTSHRPDQLRAARLLHDLAAGPDGHVIEMCGIPVTPRIAFDAMIELAAVALHRRGSHVQEPPEDVANALADTLDILEATCP